MSSFKVFGADPFQQPKKDDEVKIVPPINQWPGIVVKLFHKLPSVNSWLRILWVKGALFISLLVKLYWTLVEMLHTYSFIRHLYSQTVGIAVIAFTLMLYPWMASTSFASFPWDIFTRLFGEEANFFPQLSTAFALSTLTILWILFEFFLEKARQTAPLTRQAYIIIVSSPILGLMAVLINPTVFSNQPGTADFYFHIASSIRAIIPYQLTALVLFFACAIPEHFLHHYTLGIGVKVQFEPNQIMYT